MIKLKIGTTTKRCDVIVEPNETLGQAIEKSEISIQGCALNLNGALIPGVDTDKTFAELGVADGSTASLIAVVKADSAQ